MSGQPRTLLLTGATGAVGAAVVERLASRGDQLFLTGRKLDRLELLKKEHDPADRIGFANLDATTPEGAAEAVAGAVTRFGRVDGLVHLVGDFAVGPVERTEVAVYERLLQACFLSAVTATKAVLPHLGEDSHLVYIGTPLATEPLAGFGAYASVKAALLAWVKALSHEIKGRGIHANSVVMTMADTPQARAERPHADFSHAITPDAVAEVIAFLTSPAARGVFGAAVPVLGQFGFSSSLGGPPPGRR
jgi:NAD(P)-dependent dehydrogenase (short-subunit alcohol dehydrogenase family)